MRSAAYSFIALFISLTLVGCLKCHAMACLLEVRTEVVNGEGQPIESFSGTAMVEGTSYVFGCGGAEIPIVAGAEVVRHCFEGWVLIPFPEGTQPQIELRVESSEGLSYEGTIEPVYVVNNAFNGKGCGSCTTGSASIVLE